MHASGARTHRWSQTSPREVVCLPVCSFRLFLRETALLAGVVVAFENGLANAVPHEHPLDGFAIRLQRGRSSSDGRPRRPQTRHDGVTPSGTACPSPSGGPSGGCSWPPRSNPRRSRRRSTAGLRASEFGNLSSIRQRDSGISANTLTAVLNGDAACQLACLGIDVVLPRPGEVRH